MKTLTVAQARKLGYRITKGSYVGTSDDRIDRWYVDSADSDTADKRGPGARTQLEALRELTRLVESRK